MHESQNVMGADSQNRLLYPTKSLQKELGFFLQNCGGAQFLKFLVKIGGKRRKNDRKYAIFQNSPNARPKMLNVWNKCLVHHLGGCFARFLNSVLSFGLWKIAYFRSFLRRFPPILTENFKNCALPQFCRKNPNSVGNDLRGTRVSTRCEELLKQVKVEPYSHWLREVQFHFLLSLFSLVELEETKKCG